jgi:hypothetical protein
MERFTGSWARGKVGNLGRLHSTDAVLFAEFAAQNRKCLVPQGLTDLGSVPKRSETFRFFPKLSVAFGRVPRRSVLFGWFPTGSQPG